MPQHMSAEMRIALARLVAPAIAEEMATARISYASSDTLPVTIFLSTDDC